MGIPIDQALCARAIARGNPNLWLSQDKHDQEAARVICRQCQFQVECAIQADEANASCGVWGGIIVGRYVEEVEAHYNSHPGVPHKKKPARMAEQDPPGPSEADRKRQYARVQRGRRGAAARIAKRG
jgi:Transcription factor WhiB